MLGRQDFAKVLTKRPFSPFRIHLTDGSHYEIFHPDCVAVIGRHKAMVFHALSAQLPDYLELYDTISLDHVTRFTAILNRAT